MTTYVLVPGACHGAWWYDDLADQLRSHGHRVLAITPAGIGERSGLRHAGVNLDTHIEEVVATLDIHRAEPAVLVGHSYGGMVITGVADRVPEKVDALVYLDAFVPTDGDSVWHLTNDYFRRWIAGVDDTGDGVPPLPFFDPRATAHPVASMLQPIRLSGDLSQFRRRDYVFATKWDGESPFLRFFEHARDDPSWTTHALDGAHNLIRDNPDDLLRILLDVAR
jgi:pimeloyl-ACP methyl ester carboxylesterase